MVNPTKGGDGRWVQKRLTCKEQPVRIEGKAAVVSGGASGIGRAADLALVERGAKVVVADVDDDGGRSTVEMAEEAGGVAAAVGNAASGPPL